MSVERSASGPSLLVSIHDVSPLTAADAERAVELAVESGVPAEALTVLVVPRHEDKASLRDTPALCAWLRELGDRGATLVAHGLTHRMRRRVLWPQRAFWAYLFAAGQGELYSATAAETREALALVRHDFTEAGLEPALRGFVPPAWLLSPAARREVDAAGFSFVETMAGIRFGRRLLARRLIGWGARHPLESALTAAWARLQTARPPADTRLAIHPADLRSAICRRSIRRALATLLGRMPARSYADFLRISDGAESAA